MGDTRACHAAPDDDHVCILWQIPRRAMGSQERRGLGVPEGLRGLLAWRIAWRPVCLLSRHGGLDSPMILLPWGSYLGGLESMGELCVFDFLGRVIKRTE